jgi:hypothetical protein
LAADYTAVELDLHPGATITSGHRSLQLTLDGNRRFVTLNSLISGGLRAGQWNRVRIPMSSLLGSGESFFRAVLFNNSSSSGFVFNLDRLVLIRASALIPAPAPSVSPSPLPPPVTLPPADVTLNVNPASNQAVSPLIYGMNGSAAYRGVSLVRSSGNRWSTYNWENNASNAGVDWYYGVYKDLSYAGSIRNAHGAGAHALVTIPMMDFLTSGTGIQTTVQGSPTTVITTNASDGNSQWVRNHARKGSALLLSPSLSDGRVFQDEAVHSLVAQYGGAAQRVMYSLDNEPGLWAEMHPKDHPAKPTYAEVSAKTREFSKMIRERDPSALIFGGGMYGYGEMKNLQNAPDARQPGSAWDYTEYLLSQMAQAETEAGRRTVDVLDLHWYPEIRADGYRIAEESRMNETGYVNPSETLIQARLQGTRSLWDPTFVEQSWITEPWHVGGAIALIPTMKGLIQRSYPGTGLALMEYNYGGGAHVSGAIAQADALGIFAREGLMAAALWPFSDQGASSYTAGGFALLRNFDGAGGSVGDRYLESRSSDHQKVSVYSYSHSSRPGSLAVLVLNKTATSLSANLLVDSHAGAESARVYRVAQGQPQPKLVGTATLSSGKIALQLPAYSASVLVLDK